MNLKNLTGKITSRGPVSVALAVVFSVLFVTGVVGAATTISTNIATGGTLSVTGASSLNGNVNVNGNATTTASTGAFATEGGLTVKGSTTLGDAASDTLTITANASTTNALTVAKNFYVAGRATTTAATGNIATEGSITATDLNLGDSTGSVSTDAVTINTSAGVITDATNVNASTTRAAITFTNSKISATSVVLVSICSTPDSDARLGVTATPGSGSATLTVFNAGSLNQTSDYKVCFVVIN